MKILYILRSEPDETGKKMMETHKQDNEVTVVDLRENVVHDELVDLIFSHDKVISW